MGVQSVDIKSYESTLNDSLEVLKEHCSGKYYEKYFLYKCNTCNKDTDNEYLKYKYLSLDSCNIVDYLNKKYSGELDAEYRRKRILRKIDRIEFEWECDDILDNKNGECCEWKAIEW